jgi:peptide/nickel transport system substrate-binding protein
MLSNLSKPLLLLSLTGLVLTLLTACAPATPVTVKETVIVRETAVPVKQTVVVKETVAVTVKETVPVPVKETVAVTVKETVQVPVVVTPTPVPPPIKKSGPVFIGSGGMTGKHYNPIWMTSNPQFLTFPLILPALTWFNDQVQPIPDLATKIDVNADATVYTFTLPKEARWSDGTPLTAKDVAFTFKLAIDPIVGQSVWVNNFASIKGAAEYQKGTVKDVEGIKIVDDQTIRFELKEPNASFLFNTYLGILPSHILSKVDPKDLEKNAYVDAPTVTSGPYDFVKYEAGQYIQLKKKANYWNASKQVSIEEIYVKLIDQTATMLAQSEAGELHLAVIPAEEVARFRKLAHIEVMPITGIGYYVLHVDARNKDQIAALMKPKDQGGKGYATITRVPKPYLLDKRFRQALQYAIDKKAVIQVVAGGEANPIYGPIFGPDWAVNPNLNKYDLNIDKAKSLMKDAGIVFDKDTATWEGKPITLVYLSDSNEEARKLGEVLQQQLSKVGIRLDIKLVTSAAFLQAAIDGEGDLIRNAGGRFGADPSVSALYYGCKAGWAELVMGYCNPKFDDLMSKGVATSKSADRQKIYWEASTILNDELPSLFLFTSNRFAGVNKGLSGLKPSADPGYLTWNIQQWSFQK